MASQKIKLKDVPVHRIRQDKPTEQETYERHFYSNQGKSIDSEKDAYAKSVFNSETKTMRYFIAFIASKPLNFDRNDRKEQHTFRRVSEPCFNSYLRYLKKRLDIDFMDCVRFTNE